MSEGAKLCLPVGIELMASTSCSEIKKNFTHAGHSSHHPLPSR
jgi:hypothetical protein